MQADEPARQVRPLFLFGTVVLLNGYGWVADGKNIRASLAIVCIFVLARIIENAGFQRGSSLGDLALILFFLCMLMVPCYLASRTVRGKRAAREALGAAAGVFATAESFMDGDRTVIPCEPTVDRRALAIQRSREIYFRNGGKPPRPDYGPLSDREKVSSSHYRNRKAS